MTYSSPYHMMISIIMAIGKEGQKSKAEMEELWANFNPTIGTKDRMDREGVSTHFQSKVANNLNKMAMVSLTISPEIDVNRVMEGMK